MSLRAALSRFFKTPARGDPTRSNVIIPVILLALGLGLGMIFQVWLGYRATQQWRTSANMVVERRANEVASLLIIALIRDMRGAYESVAPLQKEQLLSDSPRELADVIARTFARYPYIDSFFLWRSSGPSAGSSVLFERAERPPQWSTNAFRDDNSFPVTIVSSSKQADTMASLARDYAVGDEPFVYFDATLERTPYQVVARLLRSESNKSVSVVLGFGVSLPWVSSTYFPEFTRQIERVVGKQAPTALSLAVRDENGETITQTRPEKPSGPFQEKTFLLTFFDPSLVPISALDHMTVRRWTARVSAANDPLLGAADAGSRRTWILIVSATAISLVAVVLVVRLLRMNFQLFAMKSDFVAMVSHELKTPLSGISLVGQALADGRCRPEQIRDYGALVCKETRRLNRLVENLLDFSRVTLSKNLYVLNPVALPELMIEALEQLQAQIDEKRMRIRNDIAEALPPLMCDAEAVTQVFVNVLENAIKYSGEEMEIQITARVLGRRLSICVRDFGHGILAQDVPRVFDRFFRGDNAGLNGTGLGLAIARKIIKDHDGEISVESAAGRGTVVTIQLPAASGVSHEKANIDHRG